MNPPLSVTWTETPSIPEPDHETVLERQLAFGYTHEDLRILSPLPDA